MRPLPVFCATGLCLACVGHQPLPEPVSFVPCEVPYVVTSDSMGRQVQGAGFTFCLPQAWQPVDPGHDSMDSNRWQQGPNRLVWSIGSPPVMVGMSAVIVGSVVTGTSTPPPAPPIRYSPRCATPDTSSITVDSVSLQITQFSCQGTWTTTAWSTAPLIYVRSVVHNPRAAKLMLAVMQSIRFSAAAAR